jgi:DNA-binding PadR family transcriptional regulator
MASNMSIRDFVLGLLARQPMAGYDIKRFLNKLSWLIGSPSFGSLYPTLHALLRDGLATMEVVPNRDRPPRKTYTITAAGRQVLNERLGQPTAAGFSLKAFVMHLALASHLSHTDLRAYLEGRRAQVAAHRGNLEQATTAMDENVDLGECLMIDYGLVLATAELDWLDHTLARLSEPSLLAEAVQSGFATLAV